MDKNTEYEKFTQGIYQKLLEKENLSIVTQHNVKVQGKSLKHQIDVYWEYETAGINHKVAIECKNYSKPISVGKIRDFFGVLSDIGNIAGVMVTKVGYQKGAKDFAEQYGIKLIVLRDPTEKDWEGRIKTLSTRVEAISFQIISWNFELDLNWGIKKFSPNELKTVRFKFSGKTDEIWILNSKNERVKNLLQLEDGLPFNESKHNDLRHTYNFDDAFVISNDQELVKISKIHYNYNILINTTIFENDITKSVKAILEDILSGNLKFIN